MSKKIIKVAKKMNAKGYSNEEISEMTGLSIEEIKKIIEKSN